MLLNIACDPFCVYILKYYPKMSVKITDQVKWDRFKAYPVFADG